MMRRFSISAIVLSMITSTELVRSQSAQTQAMCIEHLGDSDKFIIGVAIGESDAGTKLCSEDSANRVGLPDIWEHVVESKLAMQLIAIAEATPSDEGQHPHEFGTLDVVIIKGDAKHVVALNRAHSALLLDALQRSCTDRSLRKRLAHLEDQIRPR